MATSYSEFYDYVLPDVPGCPQAIATRAIRQAAIEFCERTGVWHIDHPAVNVVATQASYPFAAGVTGAVVHKVLQAWHGTKEIFPATLQQLNDLYPGDWRTKSGTPERFTQYNPRNVILVPIPAAGLVAGLKMIVSLKPTKTSTDIDTTVFEEYHDKIAHGAKSILMLSPKKPYSNPELGAAEKAMFEDAIATAHERVAKAFGRARRRVRPHFF